MLDYPFYDSDHEIEQRSGADIPLIFEREGEAGFRRRERDIIAELTARQRIVLATGGGAILNADSRHELASRGWVVYLETSIEQQAERAGRTRHRPLLHGGDPKARLEELMGWCRERLAAYKAPRWIYDAPELPRNSGGKVLKAKLVEAAKAPPPSGDER